MIHSTLGRDETSLMDPIQSSNTGRNSIEYGFSHLSLSSFNDGNRAPALSGSSVSSIPSVGDDGNPINSGRVNENGHIYPPPSPLSPSSPLMENGFSTPKIVRHNSYDSRPINNQDQSKFNRERSSTDYKAYGILKSSKGASEPTWISRQKQGQEKSHMNSVNADLSDDFGFWSNQNDAITSNMMKHKHSHSLQEMGSVDENEQYLGNRVRARTLSAGTAYHSFSNNNFDSPTFARERKGSNLFVDTTVQNQQPVSNLSQMQFQSPGYGQNHHIPTAGSFPYAQTTLNHDLREHPQVNEFDFSPASFNNHTFHNRQRVMSADAVTHRRVRSSPRYAHEKFIHHSPLIVDKRPPNAAVNGSPFIDTIRQNNNSPEHPASYPTYANDARLDIVHMNSVVPPLRHHMPEPHHMPAPAEVYGYYQNQVIAGTSARVIYTVKFKRSQRNFVLSPHILGDIKIGTYVKVEADRGEDLGIVLSRVPAEKFHMNSSRYSRFGSSDPLANNSGLPDMKKILNIATNEDIALLQIKEEEEAELLKICKGKTEQRGLPMNVVDAEYQFDRHKLTFFFEAEGRIDFRELVRELFSIYKTRIWMQQIDKNGVGSSCNNNSTVATPATCEKRNEEQNKQSSATTNIED